jgi:hypothetical protein
MSASLNSPAKPDIMQRSIVTLFDMKRTCSVVIRLFARLSVFMLLAISLAGCPSKEGTLPATNPARFFQEPAPLPPVSYSSVDEPFVGFLRDSDVAVDDDGNALPETQPYLERNDTALNLLSYDPSLPADENLSVGGDNPAVVVTADTGLLAMLNTTNDDERRTEHTVYSKSDTVFVVTHSSGEIRALRHFTNPVCEIIPVQTVASETDGAGDILHRVINAPWVYVKTSASTCNGSGSEYSDTHTRYYKLPLNYDANASKFEVCVGEFVGDEPGVNTNEETCKTRKFSAVLESEARAQLLFGWELDASTAEANDYHLTYGYLGYGIAEQRLNFFDSSRSVLWSQARGIERVEVFDEDATPYIFALQHLSDYNYMLQLGRDIFVLNSTLDLFNKSFLDEDDILSDRVYLLDRRFENEGSREVLSPVAVQSNGSDMILLDQSKLLKHDYISSSFSPAAVDLLRDYSVVYEDQLRPLADFSSTRTFSQFDIQSCQDEGAGDEELSQIERDELIDDCVNAHDVADAQLPSPGEPWQFVTECDNLLGCTVAVDNADYCVTSQELLANPSLAELNNSCTPANYLHLNELDQADNNAELIGFLQYADAHVRELSLTLDGNTIFMLAKMKERELLLRYQYLEPLSGPIADREQVMLGRRHKHFGLRTQLSDNGIFITTLRKQGTRANECYKNYQRVSCELVNDTGAGSSTSCTGKDLADGDCTDQFDEYASYPLYCSDAQIQAGACTEECTQQQIDNGFCAPSCAPADIDAGICPLALQPVFHLMADRAKAPFGKWLPANDYSSAQPEQKLYLLATDDTSSVVDEGVLLNPSLWEVDSANDQLSDAAIATLDTAVEDVLPARIENTNTAWIDLVSQDVVQVGGRVGGGNVSNATQIYLQAPTSMSPSVDTVAEFQYLRVE